MNDEFKALIRLALAGPEGADVWLLWDAMVAGVQGLDSRAQLEMVGDGFLGIVEVMERRAAVFLVRPELEEQEPVMSEDAFSCFVRQFMDVDFSQFVVGVERKEHDYPDSRVVFLGDDEEVELWVEEVESTIGESDVDALEHDEDVNAWAETVREWVRHQGRSVWIGEVVDATSLSATKVWIAGLLGGFVFEIKNDFYSPDRLILSVDSIDRDMVA